MISGDWSGKKPDQSPFFIPDQLRPPTKNIYLTDYPIPTPSAKIPHMTHHDPLHPHSHDPNPEPPSADPTIALTLPDGRIQSITSQHLQTLPGFSLEDCYIISTGHGTTGPFTFTGTTLHTLIEEHTPEFPTYDHLEVISGDGFGTRITREELQHPANPNRPILLAWQIDGRPLTRHEGLIRLIVPTETDDALRQVKWIGRINIKP
jgi:hypothetical protein